MLHIDQHLAGLITTFGPGAYLILFLILLLETGCILTVFLPGDSLLFVAGAGAASGLFSLSWLIIIFFLAGVAGELESQGLEEVGQEAPGAPRLMATD